MRDGVRVVEATNPSVLAKCCKTPAEIAFVREAMERDAAAMCAFYAWLEGALGHQFLNSDVYFIDYLPSQVQVEDVVLVCTAALLLSFFATLYPARRAARIQPAEALRYE